MASIVFSISPGPLAQSGASPQITIACPDDTMDMTYQLFVVIDTKGVVHPFTLNPGTNSWSGPFSVANCFPGRAVISAMVKNSTGVYSAASYNIIIGADDSRLFAAVDAGRLMVDLLIAEFGNSPNLQNYILGLGAGLNRLEQTFVDLQEPRWLKNAQGAVLDAAGTIPVQPRRIQYTVITPFFGFVGQPSVTGFDQGLLREDGQSVESIGSSNLTDPYYRRYIYAKIAKNTGRGTREDMIASYALIYDAPLIVVSEEPGAQVIIGIGRLLTPTDIEYARDSKLFVKPGGVGVQDVRYFDPLNTFGFAEQGFMTFGAGALAHSVFE